VLLLPLVSQAGPTIERWTLDNGTRVYFVAAPELPMVQLRVAFDAAGARDPKDKNGLAQLTNLMLREGAAGLSTDDIAQRFEGLGAEFGTGAGRDMATVDLRSLTDRALLEPALELFANIVTMPTFPAESLARERARMLVGLAQEKQSPGAVAQKLFMRTLYGEHPYAADPSGDEQSLARIGRADMVEHYRRYYVGRNAWLVMVGDLSLAQARRIAQRVVGALPAGETPAALPSPAVLAAPIEKLNEFPSSQSHVLVGQPGIARGDSDYYALYVGNYILGGGGLVSRLSNEIREKRGLSYSVYSDFSPMRVPGPFLMGLQTRNAQRGEALRVIRSVLETFTREGPTAQELEAAKKNITGGFPLRLDSNRKIADQLGVIAYYDLPLSYLDDFSARVEAVTAEQVRDAFRRRLNVERMATVIVGGKP
jgi:zinc protease